MFPLGNIPLIQNGAKTVPIKGIHDKRQITATFTVSMTGKFLPIQLIYEGKAPRCLPRFHFPADFNVTFSDNHLSKMEKSIELFEKVIFSNLKQAKASLKYTKEQMSLIIKDFFKAQDKDVILGLCDNHMCCYRWLFSFHRTSRTNFNHLTLL